MYINAIVSRQQHIGNSSYFREFGPDIIQFYGKYGQQMGHEWLSSGLTGRFKYGFPITDLNSTHRDALALNN